MLHRTLLALGAVGLLAFLAPVYPDEAGQDDKKAAATEAKKKEPSKDDKKDDKKKTPIAKPRAAVFRLHGSISEAPAQEELFIFGGSKAITLKDLVARFKQAAEDSSVKAVVILSEGEGAGVAQTEELRQAMDVVRAAGKEIHVHADNMSMREYLLMSGATRISVVPTADLWLTGLYGEAPYLRGLLEKLGVQPDFLHCGDYKSASEIFMRTGPSPEAERMQNWLLDSLYDTYTKLIAKGRKVSPSQARAWIDAGPYTAERAKAVGIIDAVESRQEFTTAMKAKFGNDIVFDHRYGKKQPPKVDFSSPFAVFKVWADMLSEAQKKKSGKTSVAIVYVQGPIMLGAGGGFSPFGDEEGAYSTKVRQALDEAAKDDTIKAVVLRVDSPGGSAVASEIILDATKRVKAKKPFIVSMGNVAGSGGYYVACGADTIYADEGTITGSIGVVGGKFATNAMWNKIGITFKSYKRGENAGILSSERTFSPTERERIQAWMDEIYKVFKDHVVEIRGKKLTKPIDDLAGGRVYTGEQALKLGLIDKIGSLQDAIKEVAGKAHLTDYDVRVVPAPKSFFEALVEEQEGGKEDPASVRLGAGRSVNVLDLALPYLKGLDPQRLRLVTQALKRLQLMQQEGAILMMPELMLP